MFTSTYTISRIISYFLSYELSGQCEILASIKSISFDLYIWRKGPSDNPSALRYAVIPSSSPN